MPHNIIDLPENTRETFRDPVTGRTVCRLVSGGINISPYFNNYAFSADGEWFCYVALADGQATVMACEVATGRRRKLAGPFPAGTVWSTLNAIPGTRAVTFAAENAVWRADIDGKAAERLTGPLSVEAADIGDSDVTGDGRWHVLGLVRASAEAREAGKTVGWPPDEHYRKYGISTLLVRVDLQSGAVEELWEEPAPACVDHISVNPLDNDLILYCHEGAIPYQYGRMFLRRLGEDASRPIRDQRSGRVKVTHERWFADGRRIAYHGMYLGETPRHYVGIFDIDRDLPLEYPLDNPAIAAWHSTPSPDGTRLAMDQQAGHTGIRLLTLEDGVWRTELATSVCSGDDPALYWQNREQDPNWRPDGRAILFRAAEAGGVSIYLVEV